MFLIDHNYILSVSDDNCLRLWSIIDRSLISVLETNQSTLVDLSSTLQDVTNFNQINCTVDLLKLIFNLALSKFH